jgi:hypothetical protein
MESFLNEIQVSEKIQVSLACYETVAAAEKDHST